MDCGRTRRPRPPGPVDGPAVVSPRAASTDRGCAASAPAALRASAADPWSGATPVALGGNPGSAGPVGPLLASFGLGAPMSRRRSASTLLSPLGTKPAVA